MSSSFVFESSIQGVGTWCFTAFDRCDRTEIVGTEGNIVYSTFDAEPIRVTTRSGNADYLLDDLPHIQQPLIQTLVDELNGMAWCPSTGASAARTSWAIGRMLKDVRQKQ